MEQFVGMRFIRLASRGRNLLFKTKFVQIGSGVRPEGRLKEKPNYFNIYDDQEKLYVAHWQKLC